jgi:hypothetical protein
MGAAETDIRNGAILIKRVQLCTVPPVQISGGGCGANDSKTAEE